MEFGHTKTQVCEKVLVALTRSGRGELKEAKGRESDEIRFERDFGGGEGKGMTGQRLWKGWVLGKKRKVRRAETKGIATRGENIAHYATSPFQRIDGRKKKKGEKGRVARV